MKKLIYAIIFIFIFSSNSFAEGLNWMEQAISDSIKDSFAPPVQSKLPGVRCDEIVNVKQLGNGRFKVRCIKYQGGNEP